MTEETEFVDQLKDAILAADTKTNEITELDVARLVRDEVLTSPQKFQNIWLFNIRITGTSLSLRSGLGEYVYRPEAHYLNDEFLARCNGLPVVLDHPEVGVLNSKEFAARISGTVFLPFIKDEDVWAVVKIFDDDVAELMRSGEMSTSPGVSFSDPENTNQKIAVKDGLHWLVEGKPGLLDHIAIVPNGVWDKGGPPVGISHDSILERNDSMTEEEKSKFDSATQALASMTARMDAIEKERAEEKADKAKKDSEEKDAKDKADKAKKDADEMAADKAKKDAFEAEEKEKADKAKKDADEKFEAEEKAKADAAKKDADDKEAEEKAKADKAKKDADDVKENEERESGEKVASKKDADCAMEDKAKKDAEEDKGAKDDSIKADAQMNEMTEMKAQLTAMAALVKQLTAETTPGERDALASAQARADSVSAMFGERASPPISGETALGYRKRLLKGFQRHSAQFKDTDAGAFGSLNDAMLTPIEGLIYADAQAAARNPAAASNVGVLVPVIERDMAGRNITRFVGDPMAWMQHYMGTGTNGRLNSFSANGQRQ